MYLQFPNSICTKPFNISTWRKSGLASNPLFIIPGFFLYFSLEFSYGYLRFEGNGKIPLGRQGIWRGKVWAFDRNNYILISTHFYHKPRLQNWLRLHSANPMVVGSNPTVCNSNFFLFLYPCPSFFPTFSSFFPTFPKEFSISFKPKVVIARL